MTSNLAGQEIPFIVRVERGTLNRGIYEVAVVEEAGAIRGPGRQSTAWNGGLVHIFGGSTGTPDRQNPPISNWGFDDALTQGFMISVSSLTDQALKANKVATPDGGV